MWLLRRPAAGPLAGTVAVFIFFAIASVGNAFLTAGGTASWLDPAAELGIVAIPVGLLMMGGEFDLSIASVLEASALTVSVASGRYGVPLPLSIAMALAIAAVVGLLNGIITVRTRVPSFIVTLATYLALDGATLALTTLLTSTVTVSLTTRGAVHSIFAGSFHQFRSSIVWCLAIALVAGWILSRTAFGNWLLATGGDRDTARDAGVPTDRVKIILFVCSSLGAALLGIIQAIEYNGSQLGQGQSYIFDAIAASVIGGVLLRGGYGSVTGIVFGAMTYSIIGAGIYYTGWDPNLAEVFIGVLVLAAVLANNVLRSLAMRDKAPVRLREPRRS